MNQAAFAEIAAMLNSFPQGAQDYQALLKTYSKQLEGVSDAAIIETAERFTGGLVEGQNRTFAPSIAEFATEARRMHELLPYRGRAALPPPKWEPYREPPRAEKVRMGFKMAVLSAGLGIKGGPDRVAEANKRGLEDMIALGQQWGVPVPDALFDQIKKSA